MIPGRLARLHLDVASVASLLLGLALVCGVYAAIDWKFVRSLDFLVLVEYWQPLLRGALTTLLITGAALFVGLALGVAIAVLLHVPLGPIRWQSCSMSSCGGTRLWLSKTSSRVAPVH